MRVLILFFSIVFVFSNEIKLGIRGNNTIRFKNLYLPTIQSFSIPPFVFPNYKLFLSPDNAVFNYKGVEDLCNDFENKLLSTYPDLWNNTLIKNPCELYFYNTSIPEFLNSTVSTIQGLNMSPKDVHYAIQRYCTQCVSTLNQNLTINSSCKWFDQNYCNNTCWESECIYYQSELSLCYVESGNIFYWRNDFTHYFLAWLYIYYSSIIVFIINIIEIFLSIIILIIPECYIKIQKIKDKLFSPFERLRGVFDLRFFIILILTLNIILNIIFNLLDIINHYVQLGLFQGRWRNISIMITCGFSLVIFLLIIIQWYISYRKSQLFDGNLHWGMILFFSISIIVFFGWGIFGALLYLISSPLNNQDLFRVLGVWLIISSLALFLILLVMIVLVAKIYNQLVSIHTTTDSLQRANIFFSLRLSRFLIALTLSLFFVVISGIFVGIQFLISVDVFTVEFDFIFNCIVSILIQIPYIVVIFGLSPIRLPKKEN